MRNFISIPWLGLTLLAVVLAPDNAHAGMKMKPGKWEFQSEASNPMMPKNKIETSTECFEAGEVTPKAFLKDSKGCVSENEKVTDTSMEWSMSCPGLQGQSTGKASFTSRGDRIEGNMRLTMSIGNQKMTFDHKWTGKHIGPCD